jgi:anion-transporting  ArsA/GET3 family ATPase
VGKTTIAAVLALQGAIQGKQSLVITIDPAKRLATSLGLSEIGNGICPISSERLLKYGIEIKGSLSALMLDARTTVDELIARYAPSPHLEQKIVNNRLYQNFSSTFAGALEYIASEKLYQLYTERKYDLIVLDTPPTRQALDFLESPIKVLNFLQFVGPYISGKTLWIKMMQQGLNIILKAIENIIGKAFLHNITDFLSSFQGMFEGIKFRTEALKELLSSSQQTAIFLVTSPTEPILQETITLYQKLKGYHFPLGGVIVNRIHDFSPYAYPSNSEEKPEDLWKDLASWLSEEDFWFLRQYLEDNYQKMKLEAQADELALQVLQKIKQETEFFVRIPYFPNDIIDLPGLKKINDLLFPE